MRIRRLAHGSSILLAAGLSLAAFSLTFTHLAGSFGGPGFEDGAATIARFRSDAAVAVDASGNVYVADTANNTIRKIVPGGEVFTLAGLAETYGSDNGRGAHARFNAPRGIAVDGSGNVYVADSNNYTIRKITAAGVVTTFAGFPGYPGNVDNNGTSARFQSPQGLSIDPAGNLYVADTYNHSIRKITPAGDVTTIAGTGAPGSGNGTGTGASFRYPMGVAYDATSSSLFVADYYNNAIRQITLPGAVVTTFAGVIGSPGAAPGIPGRFTYPRGVSVDGSGNVYVADEWTHAIFSVTPGGSVGYVAGVPTYPGPNDGDGFAARFNAPSAVVYASGALYVADSGNHTVRKISAVGTTNTVVTLAGSAQVAGYVNNTGGAARFNGPRGLAYYPGPGASGFAYVADTYNNAIRRVGMDGVVTTLAGGTYGYLESTGTSAQFKNPQGVSMRWSDFGAYVADTGNHCIRAVTSSGTTSLVAGQPGVFGNLNGDRLTTAKFSAPQAVALNAAGNALYVADTGNYLVRKIDLVSNLVSTVAGSGSFGTTNANGTLASFGVMTGIACDSLGNVYVAESQTYTIRKINSSGDVTTLAGSFGFSPLDGTGTGAHFGYPGPTDISMWPYSTIAVVADPGSSFLPGSLLRSLTTDTGIVGTIGGKVNVSGTSDGTGSFARFLSPRNVAVAFNNTVVVSDGNSIRFGGLEIADRATATPPNTLVGTTVQLDMSPQTATSWSWSIIRRPAGSTATLSSTTTRNPTFVPDVRDLYVFRCVATSASGSSISTVSVWASGAATHLAVATGYPGPVTNVAGVPFAVTVYTRDSDDSLAYGYRGQIHFTSNDATGSLPADYTFTSSDDSTGSHAFTATFTKAGFPIITATDTANSSITGSQFAYIVAGPATSLTLSIPSSATSSVPITATVTPKDDYGNAATSYAGTVHFTSSDGAATLPANYTFTGSSSHTFTNGITLLASGTQTVTVTDTVNAALTATQDVSVAPTTPAGLVATAPDETQVSLSWNPASGADHYEIYRATGAGYTPLDTSATAGYTDLAVAGGTTYVYKIRAVGGSATTSAFGTPDAATTIVFVDDPLSSGVLIEAVHLTQLRQAVNAFRAAVGLSAITFSESIIGGTTPIRASHIQELRDGINQARGTPILGMYPLSFTDSTLFAGATTVQAVHIQELRTAVK